MTKIRIAAVQMSSTTDRARNFEAAGKLMERAVMEGASIVALPENFSFMGDEAGKLEIAEDLNTGAGVRFLRKFAKKNKVALIGGSLPLKTKDRHKVSNTCLVIDARGNITARYDKLHLFKSSLSGKHTLDESRQVKGGDRVVTFELFGRTMGVSICYDLRFPELYRAMALRGAEVIFVPAAFTLYTGKDHWHTLLRARAIENQCYIVAPGQFGELIAPGTYAYGKSLIADPWGTVLAEARDAEDMIFCDIDFDFMSDIRKRLPALENIHRKMFFSSKVYRERS